MSDHDAHMALLAAANLALVDPLETTQRMTVRERRHRQREGLLTSRYLLETERINRRIHPCKSR